MDPICIHGKAFCLTCLHVSATARSTREDVDRLEGATEQGLAELHDRVAESRQQHQQVLDQLASIAAHQLVDRELEREREDEDRELQQAREESQRRGEPFDESLWRSSRHIIEQHARRQQRDRHIYRDALETMRRVAATMDLALTEIEEARFERDVARVRLAQLHEEIAAGPAKPGRRARKAFLVHARKLTTQAQQTERLFVGLAETIRDNEQRLRQAESDVEGSIRYDLPDGDRYVIYDRRELYLQVRAIETTVEQALNVAQATWAEIIADKVVTEFGSHVLDQGHFIVRDLIDAPSVWPVAVERREEVLDHLAQTFIDVPVQDAATRTGFYLDVITPEAVLFVHPEGTWYSIARIDDPFLSEAVVCADRGCDRVFLRSTSERTIPETGRNPHTRRNTTCSECWD